ncbi:MAG: SDR family NAD(P)-dependent oxidoreductase [Bryobacteraceae bacterium]
MSPAMGPMDFLGKTVLVTGASSGIGRETAILLSELNARVIVSGRDEARLAAALGALRGTGHASSRFDVADLEKIPAWVKNLADEHGPLDGAVHCAGIQWSAGLRALSAEKLETIIRINLSSAAMLVKGFRQKGCRGSAASVVLMGSIRAVCGAAGIAAYAASKAGLEGLCRSLAIELAREGIRVNCVAPGMVESEMTSQIRASMTDEQFEAIAAKHPLGLGTTRDVAHSAAFLLSEAARWITGSVLVVDGGYSAQ